jgi:hypothetical protein
MPVTGNDKGVETRRGVALGHGVMASWSRVKRTLSHLASGNRPNKEKNSHGFFSAGRGHICTMDIFGGMV